MFSRAQEWLRPAHSKNNIFYGASDESRRSLTASTVFASVDVSCPGIHDWLAIYIEGLRSWSEACRRQWRDTNQSFSPCKLRAGKCTLSHQYCHLASAEAYICDEDLSKLVPFLGILSYGWTSSRIVMPRKNRGVRKLYRLHMQRICPKRLIWREPKGRDRGIV